MSDSNETRAETVAANIATVVDKYGDENYMRLMAVCLKDISMSLATMVDNGTTAEAAEEET